MKHIDLFSGIGGFALAAKWAGFRTVAFVEIEPYAQAIIRQNFGAIMVPDTDIKRCGNPLQRQDKVSEFSGGNESAARLYSNVFAFDGTRYRGATLLTGGFPCQPFSQAGKRRGKEDDRYLWPEMLRVISQARPAWVLGENVAGIVNMELDRALSDLEGEGYAVQTLVIPACAVDAKHRRDRVWIVGHAEGRGQKGLVRSVGDTEQDRSVSTTERSRCERQPINASEDVADAARIQQEQRAVGERVGERSESLQGRRAEEPAIWLTEPEFCGVADWLSEKLDGGEGFCSYEKEWDVPRVAHGVKNRVDRLIGLGNSIQPQVAYEILKVIADLEKRRLEDGKSRCRYLGRGL